MPHVCPWWGGYFIDNRLRRLLHNPEAILSPYVQPGMTAMDVGCGMGFFAIAMARLVGDEGEIIAVDLQQQMLDVLTKRVEKASLSDRVRTHRCEADSIGLNEQVDFALAFYSAHEVPDSSKLLGEIFDCLSPQGKFLIVEPIGHVRRGEFEKMLSLSEEVGFNVAERPRIRLSHAALLVK